jgi:aminoglycoside N3'-acetyltransferase
MVLTEIVKERIGKNCDEMRQFFQSLINNGEWTAYSVEINKRIIEKDTEEEEVVRTKKGALLTPTKELSKFRPAIIEEQGVRYSLHIGCHGSAYDDDNEDTRYNHFILEKFSKDIDYKRMFISADDRICVYSEEEKNIIAKLYMSYDEHWIDEKLEKSEGYLTISGEKDKFFEKVLAFIKN